MGEPRPIPGMPGYLASEDGTIYSARGGEPRPLKPWTSWKGYLSVRLYVGGKRVCCRVHQIVARTFYPDRSGVLVRHLDGRREHNAAANLAWGTHADNWQDRKRHEWEERYIAELRLRAMRYGLNPDSPTLLDDLEDVERFSGEVGGGYAGDLPEAPF